MTSGQAQRAAPCLPTQAFLSVFGPWLLSGLWFLAGDFGLGTRAGALGILLMLIGPFLYYVLSCRISYLVKSDLSKQWIISGVSILAIVFPLSFYAYSKTVTREINYLGTIENCTIRCVFPAQQQLEPSIDICRAQCNAKQWPSNDQRISCWNRCGGPWRRPGHNAKIPAKAVPNKPFVSAAPASNDRRLLFHLGRNP